MEQTEVMTEITEEIEKVEESEELKESENQSSAQNDIENEEAEIEEAETIKDSESEEQTETENETENETETESETESENETETETDYDKLLSLINEIDLNNENTAVDSEYQETVLQYLDNIQVYQQNLYSVNMTIAFFVALTCGILTAYATWSRMR